MFKYVTKDVCSREILFEVHDGKVSSLVFRNGCNGNLQAIGRLVEGMKVEEVIAKLEGIKCGDKKTSCADQLTKALKEYKMSGNDCK